MKTCVRKLSLLTIAATLFSAAVVRQAGAQSVSSPLANSLSTPRPFDPGQISTNPSSFAVQTQNPFLGSVPTGKLIPGNLSLSLHDAVTLALRNNLGYIDTAQEHLQSRAARIRALSTLLPQLSAESTETYRNLVSDSLGVDKLGFPHLVPPFNYQGAHVNYSEHLLDAQAIREVKSASKEIEASEAAVADARNVVVLAAVSSYLLVTASQTRVQTAEAQLTTSITTDSVLHDRVLRDVSPAIDEIRAHVARRSAEQRLAVAKVTLQKDKLALTRIIGLPIEQQFSLSDPLTFQAEPQRTLEDVLETAQARREDVQAAVARLAAAQQSVKAASAQRLPTVDVVANAGESGATYGHAFGDYVVEGRISLPIFTGRRIQSDVMTASATEHRRAAELADVRARADYDVRTAMLDLQAGTTSVEVALENIELAKEGLRQAKDRYEVGVSNAVDLIQAQEAVAEAEDNRIASVYAHSLSELMLIRAMGTALEDYATYIGVH